jgi:hypothetical protein
MIGCRKIKFWTAYFNLYKLKHDSQNGLLSRKSLQHHMSPYAVGKGLLLKADPIADAFRAEVKDGLAASHRAPTLVGILATDAPPSRSYAEFTRKQCEELGVRFILKEVGSALKQKEGETDEARSDGEGVEEAIIEANEDDNVDGIMVSSRNVRWRGMYVDCCKGVLPDIWRPAGAHRVTRVGGSLYLTIWQDHYLQQVCYVKDVCELLILPLDNLSPEGRRRPSFEIPL